MKTAHLSTCLFVLVCVLASAACQPKDPTDADDPSMSGDGDDGDDGDGDGDDGDDGDGDGDIDAGLASRGDGDAGDGDGGDGDAGDGDGTDGLDAAVVDGGGETGTVCADLTCPDHSTCDEGSAVAACVCDSGYFDDAFPGTRCLEETSVLWEEDFENGYGDWSTSNGVFQIGAPNLADGPAAHGGNSLAGTVLDDYYPNATSMRLISPAIEIPAADRNPRFRLWVWRMLRAADGLEVQIRVLDPDPGAWQTLAGLGGVKNTPWLQQVYPVAQYGGKTVQLSFVLSSANTGQPLQPGAYIDDIALEAGPMQLQSHEDFEAGPGDWHTGGGWNIGAPALADGPDSHMGNGLAGTVLDDYYGNAHSASLISPAFVVPEASEMPRVRFWSWMHLRPSDAFDVLVRAVAMNDHLWGAWDNLGTSAGVGEGWQPRILHLGAYAGKTVQIAFQLRSANTGQPGAPGIYVDDVTFETGPTTFNVKEGFEDGFGDWSSFGGTWNVGAPTLSDGPMAYQGTGVVGTALDDYYPNAYQPLLTSPAFVVPGQSPELRYWSWHELRPNDSFVVQLRTRAANTFLWSAWSPLVTVNGASKSWTPTTVKLDKWAGETVQVGFSLQSANTGQAGKPGVYLDEIQLRGE